MRKFLLSVLILALGVGYTAFAQVDTVKFSVNMKVQLRIKKFDKATDIVVVRGDFNGWSGNAQQLTDVLGDSIYVGSFRVTGTPKNITYKYVMISPNVSGDQWEVTPDRKDTIPTTPFTLKTDWFNHDSTSVYSDNFITFNVDMRSQMNQGNFDPTKDSVIVRGDFSGWGGYKYILRDSTSSGIYRGTYNIFSVKKIIYKYVYFKTGRVDKWPGNADQVDTTLNGTPKTEPLVYYTGDSSNVVFRANMKVQMRIKKFDAKTDTLVVRGDFQGWSGNKFRLTNPAADSIYVGSFYVAGTPKKLTYKFVMVSPNVAGDQWETTPDRKDTIPSKFFALPASYFSFDSTTQYSDNLVTFNVRMNKQMRTGNFNKSKDSVVVRGDFCGWGGNTYLLTDPNADSIYTGTYHIYSTQKIIYKYVIHKAAGDAWPSNADQTDSLFGVPKTLPLVWWSGDSTLTGVAELSDVAPKAYALEQNYPNPFNPSTMIVYSLVKSGPVSLKVYDILGREVVTLVDEMQNVGTYRVSFDGKVGGKTLASGMYIYKLQAGSFSSIKKMVLMK